MSELLLGPGWSSMWAGASSKSTSDGVSGLQMECGRGLGPRGMRLGSTFVLLLVDSDEPVVWLVARVVPVWFEMTSLARSLSDSFADSVLIRRLSEVVDAAKAVESFVIVAVWIWA